MNSRKRRRSSNSFSESEDDEEKRTLFVANLHSRITEEIFFELFLQAGPIESVRIPKDKESNRQKTFGFITYKYACAVPYALRLYDGIKLFGKELIIKARSIKESKETPNSYLSKESFNIRNSSTLRHGFRDTGLSDMLPNTNNSRYEIKNMHINFENFKFEPDLVKQIRGTFENPNQGNTSRHEDKHRNNYKHSSKNESRYNNRDKPYNRPNNNKRNHHSHRDDRRSDQRQNKK